MVYGVEGGTGRRDDVSGKVRNVEGCEGVPTGKGEGREMGGVGKGRETGPSPRGETTVGELEVPKREGGQRGGRDGGGLDE